MQIVLKKEEIFPLIYCISICIYYTLKGWVYSSEIFEGFLVIAVFCGLINTIRFVRKQWEKLLLFLPFIFLTIYRMLLGADTRLIVSMIAVLIGMDIDFEKIAKWLLATKIITFVFAFFIGGYMHLNYISMNMGIIISLLLYVCYPKSKWKTFIVAIITYFIAICISRSGAMILCIGIGLLLYAIMNTKIGKKILTLKIMIFLFPLVLFLNWGLAAIYAAYIYSNPDFYFIKSFIPNSLLPRVLSFLNILKVVLTGRIGLAAYSFGKFGFSLWGGNIDYGVDTGLPYFLIDSGMILLLQDWGLIMSAIVMALFVFFMYKMVKKKNYRIIISAVIISLWAFNEDTLLSVGTNYLFFAIGNELYQSRNILSTQYKKYLKRYKVKL